ncbi:hypothetical protein BS47DRAFT_1481671, partial [Hydnum rufescens UP504]
MPTTLVHWTLMVPSPIRPPPYAGPAPPFGTGPHRYTVLPYAQLSDFTAPLTRTPNSGVHLIKAD